MDYIFIDTSIFEANNFLESRRINEILKLGEEKHIQIVLPTITYNETRNRAIKNIKEAISRFKKYRDDTRTLRNIKSIKEKFENLDEEKCINEFLEIFEKRLQESQCIIPEYPTLNVKDIFEKYFNDEFPFSRGDKKHEFPDAFALLSLEKWCEENEKKCFVFSNDKDLLNYKSDLLIIVPSYEQYLNDKLREIEIKKKRQKRLDSAIKLYETQKYNLEQEIDDWIQQELEGIQSYYRHNDREVHSIDIINTEATLSDSQIVSINDYQILMEVRGDIYFEVEINVDDEDSGYYDSEDKVWNYLDTETKVIEKHQVIPVQLKVSIPAAGDEYMDIKIEEINNGNGLKIQ